MELWSDLLKATWDHREAEKQQALYYRNPGLEKIDIYFCNSPPRVGSKTLLFCHLVSFSCCISSANQILQNIWYSVVELQDENTGSLFPPLKAFVQIILSTSNWILPPAGWQLLYYTKIRPPPPLVVCNSSHFRGQSCGTAIFKKLECL